MNEQEQKTYDRLLEKSQEAFLVAIELYNRPTLKYHAEGCSFFLCNAWELMLKAYLVKRNGENSLYFKDKAMRTISLNKCISLIMTNKHDPARVNLEKIIEFRNTSTHFITNEYEILYGPLFQVSVKNYEEKLREYHSTEISEKIPENYLVLSVKRDLINPEKIRAKYTPEVAETLLQLNNSVIQGAGEDGNVRYAAMYETSLAIVKDRSKANLAVRLASSSENGVRIVKEVRDFKNSHPYTTANAIKEINGILTRRKIDIFWKGQKKESFNTYHWNEFVKFYGLKNEDQYSYNRATKGEKPRYVYSQKVVDLIVSVVEDNPANCIDQLVENNKLTPGAKDS